MAIVCNLDEYLGPEEFRRRVGTPAQQRRVTEMMKPATDPAPPGRVRCPHCSLLNRKYRARCNNCGTPL